jgi:GT2 family glycosyltransferase/phosphatidylglycerophosphate synthase
MEAAGVELFVLNYNGARLLAECLPSIVRAAARSSRRASVTVVDNGSTDDSLELLARDFPSVTVRPAPNDGLCSFNEAVAHCAAPVVILLNNDVKLADDALDPLVDPLFRRATRSQVTRIDDLDPIVFTAPRCYLFDEQTHEGFRTSVRMRRGLVEATALFPGAEAVADRPGSTASVGAVLAVDREAFVRLGGFDRLYLPGRIEDLDFCFRAFIAGGRGRYVPESIAYHRGAASFGPAFGAGGCDRLALRNTILFQWKNLRTPAHRLAARVWWPLRVARDLVRAPFVPTPERYPFLKAYSEARALWRSSQPSVATHSVDREQEFFRRHAPAELLARAGSRVNEPVAERAAADDCAGWRAAEARRSPNYPISRHYVRPWAGQLAQTLRSTPVEPWHLTLFGLLLALLAAACILGRATVGWTAMPAAAALVWAAWFCDRTDGMLARIRRNATPFGAWLDANVDETVDLGLHLAMAHTAAAATGSPLPWALVVAFLLGKYLLMHGLATTPAAADEAAMDGPVAVESADGGTHSLLRTLYHLPGNADVRLHLLVAALATDCLTAELAVIAVYYNVRWIARYALLGWRLRAAPTGAAS